MSSNFTLLGLFVLFTIMWIGQNVGFSIGPRSSFLIPGLFMQIVGVCYVAVNGRFYKTGIYRILLAFGGLISGLGILFKILHWPGANLMIIGGICALAIPYTAWFWQKADKQALDWIKWLWVVGTATLYSLSMATISGLDKSLITGINAFFVPLGLFILVAWVAYDLSQTEKLSEQQEKAIEELGRQDEHTA